MKGDWQEIQGEQANLPWSGSKELESQPLFPCTENWTRWWYPLTPGWLHEHVISRAFSLSLLMYLCFLSLCWHHQSAILPLSISVVMVPFSPSGNIRLNKIQPVKQCYLAVLVHTASLGNMRCCRQHMAINVCTQKTKLTGTTLKIQG